jgi:molybdopterin molybdotransferase
MILFEQALAITRSAAQTLPIEHCRLDEALGRVLAADVISDRDIPAHALSAMDGFACRRQDIGKPLTVIETIAAGAVPAKKVGEGQCARIMTGAIVPEGADSVVMFEHAQESNGTVQASPKGNASNIREKAEELHAGDTMLKAGCIISPVEIAVCATAGYDSVPVFARPRVGVIATGDELVEPGEKPSGAQIRNSNSYQLCAQIRQMGCSAQYLGIARDTPEAIEQTLSKAFDTYDVTLLSGGVSAGDYDFVPDVLKTNGIEIKFAKVAVKPGKPTVFGLRKSQYFFGLPGNTVSTFVIFEVLVKPFLYLLMGHNYQPCIVQGVLAEEFRRRKADRLEFRPVQIAKDGTITTPTYHGSAHIHAYTKANGIIRIEQGVVRIEKGTMVEVQILD